MICELHKQEAKLCESHIIPKFVFKWMKKTGTSRLRQVKTLNTPQQDGIKKQMLCQECENKFSKGEKWFNENVFTPFLKDNSFKVKNDKNLEYFITSILWRVIKLFKDDGNDYKFMTYLNEAEKEWSDYLIHDGQLSKYKNSHLILINSEYWISKKMDLYFSRAVDIDIVEGEDDCFIYAKFSRFILIGEIKGFSDSSFENTNITLEEEFSSTNQMINDSQIFNFFNNRIAETKGYKDLSEEQKIKTDEYHKKRIERLKNSEYQKIINKYR